MMRLGLRLTGSSYEAAGRAGLTVSSLPEEEIGFLLRDRPVPQKAAAQIIGRMPMPQEEPAFAQGYGSARAGLRGKPAEEGR